MIIATGGISCEIVLKTRKSGVLIIVINAMINMIIVSSLARPVDKKFEKM
jgi:hypothetical protein